MDFFSLIVHDIKILQKYNLLFKRVKISQKKKKKELVFGCEK